MSLSNKKRAPLNRTIIISDAEIKSYSGKLLKLIRKAELSEVTGKIINQDLFEVMDYLPDNFVDLLFLDPPYNLNKNFSSVNFKEMKSDDYEVWLDSWISKLVRTLKPNASIYFCCDWKTSIPAYNVLKKYFLIRNRITWEREKGRGSKDNWKNSHEDIWYCTLLEKFTFNIDAAQIRNLLTEKTKAVIPVHLFGLSADMDLISEICCSEKLKIIEDAACGFGAFYGGKHVGNFGDFGCFSFHPRKAITTGEGGMITINNEETAEYLRSLRDHGALISDLQRHSGMQPYLLPDFSHLGYNYRMTDIQAVLGLMQMKRADDILNKRAEIARKYDMGLKDNPFLRSPSYGEKYRHGYQSYLCMFGTEDISLDSYVRINKLRNEFMKYLFDNGISTRPGTHAVHAQNYYSRKYNIKSEDYPVSLFADRCSVSLPVFPSMTNEETDYVINTINNYKHDCI